MGERVADRLVAPLTRGLYAACPDDIDVDAAEALGTIAAAAPDTETISADLAALAHDADDYAVRQRAVQALAEIPTDGAEAALRILADDPDPRIAGTAAFILRRTDR